MASKQYAYYNKGNKIALVEKSPTGSGGKLAVAHCTLAGYTTKDTCEAAGGQWIPGSSGSVDNFGEYLSPTESITDGLEIEYTYAPTYTLNTDSTLNVNKWYILGWTVTDGYLTFLRGMRSEATNWTASPYSVIANNEYINVVGSERWNGLHKVKSAQSGGLLQTYTKVNKEVTFVQAAVGDEIDFCEVGKDPADADLVAGQSYIATQNTENVFLNALFSVGDYIWVLGADTGLWAGMWKIEDLGSSSVNEADAGLYVANKYHIHHTETNAWEEESIQNPPQTDNSGLDDANGTIRRCYRDFCYIQADITAMEDESYELDLTHQQSTAIVYYLKAKMMEEMGELERREFFMREFKRALEKSSTDKRWGTYRIQGFGMTRK